MISGDVHGPVSNMGNHNSGVIANTVNIGNLVPSNKSTQESLSQRAMISAHKVKIIEGEFTQNNYFGSSNDLHELKHVSSAGIQALDQDGCMEGTRVILLNDLHRWSMDVTAHRIFWLDGMAGTGKSAIACSLCRFLHNKRLLGGSFFCLRGNESRSNVKRILPTLAWFLACQDPDYRKSLLDILRDAPDVVDYTVERQLEFLVEQPLQNVPVGKQHTQMARLPWVLVIDALDECADAESVAKLLKKLLSVSKKLPVKFFLTSRPERHILTHFKSPHSELHRILRLHDIDHDLVEADISFYLTKRLKDIRSSRPYLPHRWPARRDVEILTHRAGKFFIYPFTAIKYIEDGDPVDRLQTLTGVTDDDDNQPFHGEIDKMYSLVLSAALDPKKCRNKEIRMTKRILGAIFATREPLYLSDIARLLGVTSYEVRANIDRIRAVINAPPQDKDGVISTLHVSFVDFLTTPGRAPENMRITLSSAHRDLAAMCLHIMESDLHFNIAECNTSYLPNSEQKLATISAPLKYSCRHWAHHIEVADDAASLLAHLENVLITKFLFWLEVLSVLGMAGLASSLISRLLTAETTSQSMTEKLATFLRDANDFVIVFRDVIEMSVPHIYLSALPSVRRTSKIAQVFGCKYPSTMKVTAEGFQEQRKALLELRGHISSVNSVSFSSNGNRVLSGSQDWTIRIWDARTGEEVIEPLEGHTSCVASVCFSSDGTRIISGSYDKTIRIWDATTGEEVMKPLKGHTDSVFCIGFSPDETLIVSGSEDMTIRIWDARTGKEVMRPLEGHTEWVWSVCFSPDGTRIASSSSDKTIKIWDTRTGWLRQTFYVYPWVRSICFSPDGTSLVTCSDETIQILDASSGKLMIPLKGHTARVWCVAFSPDGTRIVSGSADRTIRIWDARTGEQVINPLKGHTQDVISIGFSPGGTRVVSGSVDKTIRIWDVEGVEVILPSYEQSWVRSICFSPDGACVVSGSDDNTLRIWDARTGEDVKKPLKGHTDKVWSVGFSADGTRIVSGSEDNTIRIWDARTGEGVMILQGHTSTVATACFSPDGKRIVSGSIDTTIRIWDTRTGEEVMKPLKRHTKVVQAVCFSPDGTRIVSGSDDHTIRIWDARTAEEVMKPLKGHIMAVLSIDYSPDGTRIASGSDDKTIRIWDAKTGQEAMKPLKGHTLLVTSVCFSHDGTCIVSGSYDETVRIWDARTGKVIQPLFGHSDWVRSVCFSPDGTRIASGSHDNIIRIWDAVTGVQWHQVNSLVLSLHPMGGSRGLLESLFSGSFLNGGDLWSGHPVFFSLESPESYLTDHIMFMERSG